MKLYRYNRNIAINVIVINEVESSDFVLKWGQRFFFAINNKLRNAKSIEENEKLVFLIDNLMDYLVWIVICVNIDFFRGIGKKATEKKWKIAKKYISENSLFLNNWATVYCPTLVTGRLPLKTHLEVFSMKLQLWFQKTFEKPGAAGPASPGWRSHPNKWS